MNSSLSARTRLAELSNRRKAEQGDIVQTILIIALTLVIVIAVFNSLTPAVIGQGNNIAKCISVAHKGTSGCDF